MLTSNVAHASRLRRYPHRTPARDLSELALPLAADPALSGVERACPLRSRHSPAKPAAVSQFVFRVCSQLSLSTINFLGTLNVLDLTVLRFLIPPSGSRLAISIPTRARSTHPRHPWYLIGSPVGKRIVPGECQLLANR